MFPQEQIDTLKTLYPNASIAEEGGVQFILLENLKLPEGTSPSSVTGLLCPSDRDGYPSRLYLSQQVTHKGKGQNWNPKNSVVILGKSWWAISWKITKKELTLTDLLLEHLRAFRQ